MNPVSTPRNTYVPFKALLNVFRKNPHWPQGLLTSPPLETIPSTLPSGKEAAAPSLLKNHTSEAWPASSAPPSLQAEFQVSNLLGGIVGNADIVPNIWMRTARCGQFFQSFHAVLLG